MKTFGSTLFIQLSCYFLLFSQGNRYLFSYFKVNGEVGLHLATSRDGLTWTSVNNDKSFLKPTAGKGKLMRDPCIIRDVA